MKCHCGHLPKCFAGFTTFIVIPASACWQRHDVQDQASQTNHKVTHAHSGGAGGGTPNANNTIVCQFISSQPVYCAPPGTPVPAAGGTSWASSAVTNPVFQLGPQNAPIDNEPGGAFTRGNGYVRVARVG